MGFWCRIAVISFVWGIIGSTVPNVVSAAIDKVVGLPFIRNYTTDEYRANAQNWSMVQDKRGVVYIGNNDGLLIFDGSKWKLLLMPNKSLVRSLAIDDQDRVYLGAYDEFGYLAHDKNGKPVYVSLIEKLPEIHRECGDVRKLFWTPQGVYFITPNRIFRYFNDQFEIIPVQLGQRYGAKVRDQLFVFHRQKGVYWVNGSQLFLLPGTAQFSLPNGMILALPFGDEKLLLGAHQRGLWIYDFPRFRLWQTHGKTGEPAENWLMELESPLSDIFKTNMMYAGVRFPSGQMAFGGFRGGVYFMEEDGTFVRQIGIAQGLQTEVVHELYVDRHNGLWVVLDSGVSHVDVSSPITRFGRQNGFRHSLKIVIRKGNHLYVTTNVGIHLLDDPPSIDGEGNVQFHLMPDVKWTDTSIVMFKDTVVAMTDKNLVELRGSKALQIAEESHFVNNFAQSSKFPDYLFYVAHTATGYFELTSTDPPLPGEENRRPSLKLKQKKVFDQINEPTIHMEADTNGDLWIASAYYGIIHFRFIGTSPEDAQLVRYDTDDGIPDLHDPCLIFVDDYLMVGTKKGMVQARFDAKRVAGGEPLQFEPERIFGGLFADQAVSVSMLGRDINGRIWINSSAGFGYLQPTAEGIYKWISTPFNKIAHPNHVWVDENQVSWIVGRNGLYRYDEQNAKGYTDEFDTLIRKVTLLRDHAVLFHGNYFRENTTGENRKGQRLFSGTASVQPAEMLGSLPYRANSVGFEYAATFYEHNDTIKYSYWLEGFDEEWSSWSSEAKKEYTNLPEGVYRFRVRAKNVFGHLGREAQYKFTVLPPWYRTVWAYLGYLICFTFFLWLGFRMYSWRLIAGREKLKKLVRERTVEVERQHREIFLQKEEISAQADELRFINAELENRTAEVTLQKEKLARINESLRDLDRMKSRFFANISHDLRTPLTLILAPTELMLSNKMTPEETVVQAANIRRSALELLKLINDLLDLSRLEEARMRIALTPVNLTSFFTRILDFARPLAERKRIVLELDAPSAVELEVDENKVERIFINLLSNALKFTDAGGEVTVRVLPADKTVCIAVSDNGIGIPQDSLNRIFDRFGQVDTSLTKRHGGSGIGLALVRELVKLHLGEITVESELGQGSTFVVEIPRELSHHLPEDRIEQLASHQKAALEEQHAKEGMPEWSDQILASTEYRFIGVEKATEQNRISHVENGSETKSARLLLADDNREVLNYLQQSLAYRYDIWTALDGEQAWELLLKHRHDLVVADIMMPKMNGLELCCRIKKDPRTQDTPVILLTARSETEHRVEGHAVGADKYFTKPFNLSEIRVAIWNLLEDRARQIEVGARKRSASMETLLRGMAHELHNACQHLSNAQQAYWSLAKKMSRQKDTLTADQLNKLDTRMNKMEGVSARALTRISTVVQSLKQYTQNQMQMPWKNVDLDELIEREVKLLTSADAKEVELNLCLNSNAMIRGPEEEIRQMVLNFVENAVQAVDQRGRVDVTTQQWGGKVHFTVSDNGCGVPVEFKEQIFDPFFTTKNPGEGMGLGLSLCKRTIGDLGGKVSFVSNEGEGTQFLVELPSANLEPSVTPSPPEIVS